MKRKGKKNGPKPSKPDGKSRDKGPKPKTERADPPSAEPPARPKVFHNACTAMEVLNRSTVGVAPDDPAAGYLISRGVTALRAVPGFRPVGGGHPVSSLSRDVGYNIGLMLVARYIEHSTDVKSLVHMEVADWHGAVRSKGFYGISKPPRGLDYPVTSASVLVSPVHPNQHAGDVATLLTAAPGEDPQTVLARAHAVSFVDVYLDAMDPEGRKPLGPNEMANILGRSRHAAGFVLTQGFHEPMGVNVYSYSIATDEGTATWSSTEGRWRSRWHRRADGKHRRQIIYTADASARAYPPHEVDQSWMYQRGVATPSGWLDICHAATVGPVEVYFLVLRREAPQASTLAIKGPTRFCAQFEHTWATRAASSVAAAFGAEGTGGLDERGRRLVPGSRPLPNNLVWVDGLAIVDRKLVELVKSKIATRIVGGLTWSGLVRSVEAEANSDVILSTLEPQQWGMTNAIINNSILAGVSEGGDRGLLEGMVAARTNQHDLDVIKRDLASSGDPFASASTPLWVLGVASGAGYLMMRAKGARPLVAGGLVAVALAAFRFRKRLGERLAQWADMSTRRTADGTGIGAASAGGYVTAATALGTSACAWITDRFGDQASTVVPTAKAGAKSVLRWLSTTFAGRIRQACDRAWPAPSAALVYGLGAMALTMCVVAPVTEEILPSLWWPAKIGLGLYEIGVACAVRGRAGAMHQLPALAFHCYTAATAVRMGEKGWVEDYQWRVGLHAAFNAAVIGIGCYSGGLLPLCETIGETAIAAFRVGAAAPGAGSVFGAWAEAVATEAAPPSELFSMTPMVEYLPVGQRLRGAITCGRRPEFLTYHVKDLVIKLPRGRVEGYQAVEWWEDQATIPDTCVCGLMGVCQDCASATTNQFSYMLMQTNGALFQPRPGSSRSVLTAIIHRTLADPSKGQLATPKLEAAFYKRIKKALDSIVGPLEEMLRGANTMEGNGWSLEDCAVAMGGQRGLNFRQAWHDMCVGDVNMQKILKAKWNETIALKDVRGVLAMVNRIIMSLSTGFQVEQQPCVRALADFMKDRFSIQRDARIIERHDGTTISVRFVISRDSDVQLYAQEIMEPTANLVLVSCDDSLCVGHAVTGPQGLPFTEAQADIDDYSKYDQTQFIVWFAFLLAMFARFGFTYDECMSILRTVVMNFRASAGSGADKVHISGTCHPHEPTGGAGTSIFGSLINISARFYAVFWRVSFTEACNRLGLVLKTQQVEPRDATFLRMGLARNADGESIFVNLPSACLKMGKTFRDPRSIARGVPAQLAYALVARAILASFPCVTESYPVLGAYKTTLERLASATSVPDSVVSRVESVLKDGYIAENALYKTKSRAIPTRASMVELCSRLYDLSMRDIEEMEILIGSVDSLPCFVVHSGFVKMRIADY